MSANDSRDARERWDRRYAERKGFDCRDPRAIVVEAAKLSGRQRKSDDALDLACGRGRNSIYLARAGWNVTAVDISQVALDDLAEIPAHPGRIRTVLADLEAGEFQIEPASYDLIVDTFYLQRDLFPSIRKGLRSGGLFAAEIPMEDATASLIDPGYLMKPAELRALFDGWTIDLYQEVKSGEHQRNVARLIARNPIA